MPALSGAPALAFRHIRKRFGAVAAVDGVSLDIAGGAIHAIVGENGAGKSTLMALLAGLLHADSGDISIDGARVEFRSPRDAIRLGIGMVHQHFQLVETLTALDNILLGAEGGALLARGRARLRARLATIARDHGLAIDPDARIDALGVGVRQRVEILKALTRDARVLVLDEPTAALTPGEAAELFGLMRRLAAAGTTILFITHKLGEALAAASHVSVMRAGKVIATHEAARVDAETLALAMVGRAVNQPARTPRAPGAILLSAHHLSARGDDGAMALADVSLDLRAGEIVGIAGVAGNGQTELLESLAGMRPAAGGDILIDGAPVGANYDPARARALGVAHIPEDRPRHAIIADFPARDNAMLGYCRDPRFGARLLDPAAASNHCRDLMARWDVRPAAAELAMSRFSGGNQQKLVFAREVERAPRVLLVGQPTRGVDIGAIEAIHARLLALREAGAAILLVSVELDEILALSDRILVMFGGRIIGERAAAGADRREIGLLMGGVTERAA